MTIEDSLTIQGDDMQDNNPAKEVRIAMHPWMEICIQGKVVPYIVCWLLGIGCLFSSNSMWTIADYYQYLSSRTTILQGFYHCTLAVLLLDIATHGRGALGAFIGIRSSSAIFGIADDHVQGGMFGDLSFMLPDFIQSFSGGLAASGAVISILRFITKGKF